APGLPSLNRYADIRRGTAMVSPLARHSAADECAARRGRAAAEAGALETVSAAVSICEAIDNRGAAHARNFLDLAARSPGAKLKLGFDVGAGVVLRRDRAAACVLKRADSGRESTACLTLTLHERHHTAARGCKLVRERPHALARLRLGHL